MPRDIAIAVVEHEGRFLIGQRPEGVALAGLWEFPGGKVEAGESPAQAATRECLEETGVAIEVVGEYPLHDHNYEHGAVRLHFFKCQPLHDVTPQVPFRWIARDELRKYEFPRGNDELLTLLLLPPPAANLSNRL